jgi:hypothetical protein
MYGIVNKMNPDFEYIELCLDSKGADQVGYGTGTISNWPLFNFIRQDYEIVGLKVRNAEIPFVFDTVTSFNNRFVINYSDGGPIIDYTIYLTAGTYTSTELAAELKTRLDNEVVTKLSPFTVTFTGESPSTTGSFRIVVSAQGSFTITCNEFSPLIEMGMNTGINYGNLVGGVTTLVSPNVASPEGPLYIYLNSSIVGPSINVLVPDNQPFKNQVVKIPVSVNRGAMIEYDNQSDHWLDYRGPILTQIDFYISLGKDARQIPLDFKGLGFSLTLALLVRRKSGIPINNSGGFGGSRGPSFLVP